MKSTAYSIITRELKLYPISIVILLNLAKMVCKRQAKIIPFRIKQ
jgi:hypothetical protein